MEGAQMPNNPEQPRDRDGRFGNLPPQVPTAAPAVPRRRVELSDLDADQIEELFRRLLASRGVAAETVLLGPDDTYQGVALSEDGEGSTSPDRPSATGEDWPRTYHVRFRNFHRQTLEATKELFRSRPSQLAQEEREAVFKAWVDRISDIYGMERPAMRWDTSADSGGGGYYTPSNHSITMSPNHPSIITLIHETRHALQRKGKGAPQINDDVEIDARAWSLSLYYKVRPNLLKRLVREGRVLHIDPTVFDE